MNKEEKAAAVEEMAERLADAKAIFAVDYRGLSVTETKDLRIRLSDSETTLRVVKNRLAKRAVEKAGTQGVDQLLEGPTALALVHGDPVIAAKAISGFAREHEALEFKGGLMDGMALDPDGFRTIARLPGVETLRGQLVGLAASPITGLARGLGAMLSGLAIALGQVQEQGLVGDEPEPEAESEPDAEPEPAAEPEAESEPEPEAEQAADENQTDQAEEQPEGGAAENGPEEE